MGGLFIGGGSSSAQGSVPAAATSMQVQSSVYGAALPVVYGTTRIAGNLIWYGDFTATPQTQQVQGGKGGGGSQTVQTGWAYSASYMLGLCEGEIAGIRYFWVGSTKMLLADDVRTAKVVAAKASVTTSTVFDSFVGSATQSPWSYIASVHPDQTVDYRNTAYVATANYDLQNTNTLPNFNWEVVGLGAGEVSGIYDAVPSTIINDIATNARYGALFPSSKIGDLTAYRTYCIAAGLLVSPAYSDTGTQAQQAITDLVTLTNSGLYHSEGFLKVVPYADQAITGNGVTYTPNVTPIYELTDDDYRPSEGDDPVTMTRGAIADAYNSVKLEYRNRDNDYNVTTVTASDQANIDTYGLRQMAAVQAHQICDGVVARNIAQLILQQKLYIRNQYQFILGAEYCLLEPTDYVTLSDALLGLDMHPVRILTIEEQEGDEYLITAEDAPSGVSSHSVYPSQRTAGFAMNLNVKPDNTLQPVVFEPPNDITGAGLEVWIAACGDTTWGGCDVWVSYDGTSYQQIGTISGPSRIGVLTSELPYHTDPDATNSVSVDMSQSRSTLTGTSEADWNSGSNLCIIDDEYVSFATATLTGVNTYALSTLHRGMYRSTPSAHTTGRRILRIDQQVTFSYSFSVDKIGTTIWIKLPAVNQYGSSRQGLDEIEPFQYTITGIALSSPLPAVTNLVAAYTNAIGGLTKLQWDIVTDFRQPNVDYEVRRGETWEGGMVMVRTMQPEYICPTNGTYWVSAHYTYQDTVHIYSDEPQLITITTSTLSQNVVVAWNEETTGWIGAKTSGIEVDSSTGALTINTATATSGIYSLPSSHAVDVGRICPCNILLTYSALGYRNGTNVLTMSDILTEADMLGATLGRFLSVIPQIAMANDDGVYSDWQNFVPGYYNARHFKARVQIATSDASVTMLLSDLVFTVDVPDRTDTGTLVTEAGKNAITYSTPYNGGVGSDTTPRAHITIVGQQAGDYAIISDESKTGFAVQVRNGDYYGYTWDESADSYELIEGVGVNRTINWITQGY